MIIYNSKKKSGEFKIINYTGKKRYREEKK